MRIFEDIKVRMRMRLVFTHKYASCVFMQKYARTWFKGTILIILGCSTGRYGNYRASIYYKYLTSSS